MERSWFYRVLFYAFLTLIALVFLAPSAATWFGREDKVPTWMKKHVNNKIQLGLDLQGGLHLVYEVQVDKAVSDKADRLASDLEDKLHKEKKVKSVRAERWGKDEIVLTFNPPSDASRLDRTFLKDYQKYL